MRRLLVTAVLLAVPLTACGGSPQPHPAAAPVSSSPQVSAAAACRDFAAWWAGTDGGVHAADNAALRHAVSEAPSGTLYQDMSAVETVIKNAAAGTGGDPILAVAAQVRGDCSAVNPAS